MHRRSPPRRPARLLAISRAGNFVVAPQPPPGSCHAIGSGAFTRPDPRCTPGALNPAVTQATIGRTICVPGWTSTVRPPESITEQEKQASLLAYGDSGPLSAYEYDHLVPLELGGATNDPRNLWPEPGGSPNPKDGVEYELRNRVCSGAMTLAAAQRAIATNWATLIRHRSGRPASSAGGSSATSPSTSSATCSVTARYNPSYRDYDVYVHSNQPDRSVTVSDALGHVHSWHTDASGYADVYFSDGGRTPGRRVTAHVGGASCSTSL